ncbi:MAG TPA: NAD(P)H-hydrate dehydratase [Tepidiformaceae bacterium]|nr:NAD(P)H-hydrate dehydratase [Tepidiformaceae bacterium]
MKLVTAAQMRELERAAIAGGSSEAQLMEEAGLAVAQEAWMLLGSLEGRRIVVLAGPGNNGGDGLVAGRHLAQWGAEVIAYIPGARRDTTRDEEASESGVTLVQGEDDPGAVMLEDALRGADLVIDALLGIGQTRPLDPDDPLSVVLAALKRRRGEYSPPKLVAVDLPTGVDSDSGAVDPLAVEPDLSVTFGLPKVGMYQAPASGIVGKVQVIDIGIPKEAEAKVGLELMTSRWLRSALPQRPEGGNKGTFGKLLVVGGSRRFIGAPRLAATAAYRSGAGLVTIACPATLVPALSAALAEATWFPLEPGEDGGLRGEAAIALRDEWGAYEAAVVGPGLGDTKEVRAFIWAALPDLGELPHGFVLDADGLNALAKLPDGRERVPANAVLTPHPGEMSRLLGATIADIQARRMDRAVESAEAYGCTVVLKGAHTVVAAADGRVRLSPFANPLLASAGTGDVLSGMIGGYLAQGLDPFDAASAGVYLHGAIGEAFRAEYGTSGLLAGELAEKLPAVVRELCAS